MKKVLVLGTGAQGSAASKLLDKDPHVSEIVCADYNMSAVNELVASLHKAKGMKVDAHDKSSIVKAGEGCDLILNALPLECTKNVLDAALDLKTNYQDYAATTAFDDDWVESVRYQYDVYGPKFEAIGKVALVGSGSAPGLICCATRDAMKYLDTCETIINLCWEGVRPKRFQPFWWSPITALNDMSEEALDVDDGVLHRVPAYQRPIKRKYDYMPYEVTLVDHCHDEPLHYSFNREEFFKGAKNIYFKYAGDGIDFCMPLYRAGLLNHDKEKIGDVEVSPFDVIYKHLPPAPRFPEEIKAIIDEGLICDSGAMVAECYGKKDGKDILVENHIMAPGLVDSFNKSGISAEMYITGQSGYLFSKLFIEDKFDQSGLISSDMLSMDQVDQFFAWAKELDILLETRIKEQKYQEG